MMYKYAQVFWMHREHVIHASNLILMCLNNSDLDFVFNSSYKKIIFRVNFT